ncbi:hypothetical protein H8K52_05985 [Undibacterium seohonense]|uniref:STAS/SEC14 domain-containing protein n=1 Tax=Undibacterium seohonense TaxID=1344950 RepID=A0ABR6X3H5_9BURK|nr:hypothetical protein [Undibacterium seohonense]MBC3806894.1 hypothetical protein [Undibacterium seohonense]
MAFQANQHGQFALQWKGDILIAVYEGMWNEVAASNLHAQAQILWSVRQGKKWGFISDARNWEGATAETLELWWKFFEDAVANGLVAVTDILPTQFHESMVSPLAERASKIAHYQRSKDVDAAISWLRSKELRDH